MVHLGGTAQYGAGTWTRRKGDDEYRKCGAGEGWRRSFGPIL